MHHQYHNHSHELRPVDGCAALPLGISCRLCRWRRICTGCFTRGWTLRAFCRTTTGFLHIKDGKKIEALALCVGRRRGPISGIYLAAANCSKE